MMHKCISTYGSKTWGWEKDHFSYIPHKWSKTQKFNSLWIKVFWFFYCTVFWKCPLWFTHLPMKAEHNLLAVHSDPGIHLNFSKSLLPGAHIFKDVGMWNTCSSMPWYNACTCLLPVTNVFMSQLLGQFFTNETCMFCLMWCVWNSIAGYNIMSSPTRVSACGIFQHQNSFIWGGGGFTYALAGSIQALVNGIQFWKILWKLDTICCAFC